MEAEALTEYVSDRALRQVRPVQADGVHIEIAVGFRGAVPAVVKKVDHDGVIAGSPIPLHGDRVGLAGRMRCVGRQRPAELCAVHRDGVECVAEIGILADLENELIRTGTDRW